MGVLDSIIQMKRQGIPDNEIISQLREQGFSPKEINDALRHSEIKDAVSRENPEDTAPAPGEEDVYTPQQENYPPAQEQTTQEYYPQENYYSQGQPSAGLNSDTIVEISEQVFQEQSKKMKKSVDELNEFKSLSQARIENALDRIKRIEAVIDKLQISILEKIGTYGSNIEGIKKEMSMMQDSFGKMVGKAVERKTEKKSK
jgi:DNA-binding transcriptional MerR regulator